MAWSVSVSPRQVLHVIHLLLKSTKRQRKQAYTLLKISKKWSMLILSRQFIGAMEMIANIAEDRAQAWSKEMESG